MQTDGAPPAAGHAEPHRQLGGVRVAAQRLHGGHQKPGAHAHRARQLHHPPPRILGGAAMVVTTNKKNGIAKPVTVLWSLAGSLRPSLTNTGRELRPWIV